MLTCQRCNKDYYNNCNKNVTICFSCTCELLEDAAQDYYVDCLFGAYAFANGNLEQFRLITKNFVKPKVDYNNLRKMYFGGYF